MELNILDTIKYQGEKWKIVEFDADGLVRLMSEERYDNDGVKWGKVTKWVSKQQIIDDNSKEGIIKSNGIVSFRQEDDTYIVANRSEIIYDGYDYNVAESYYYNFLDRDVPVMKEAVCEYDNVAHE